MFGRRFTSVLAISAMVVACALGLIAALQAGGGAAASPLLDPGAVVRWGLPAAKAVHNLSFAATLGAFVVAAWALAPKQRAYRRALATGLIASALWVLSCIAVAMLTYASVDPDAIGPDFGPRFWFFATTIDLGRQLLIETGIALIVSVLAAAVSDRRWVLTVAALAAAGALPLAQAGHASGLSGHALAVSSMLLHLLGASLWIGGLLALVVVRDALAAEPGRGVGVVERYSSLALFGFVLVAGSGFLNAVLRVGNWSNLATPYGQLLVWKAAVLIVLGVAGAVNRLWLVRAMGRAATAAAAARRFWAVVSCELVLMGLVMGFSVALARTATPLPQTASTDPTPAQLLTGDLVPPEPSSLTWISAWSIDPLWLTVGGFGIAWYLAGVMRLMRRGDRWPIVRTLSWTAGMLLLIWTTSGGLNVYQGTLFSAHMTMHMILTMVIPVLLVPGAPVTLVARAAHKRADGSWGAREWTLWAVRTPWARFVANPIVAAIIFAGSLIVFYYTGLFEWSLRDHLGHIWMVTHFLISGYLFVQALVGIDPGPSRPPYPMRLLLLVVTMAFHAFFGVSLMMGSGLLAADWYGAMGRTWGLDPLADQKMGGGIAWGIGELPTVCLAVVVGVLWARADERLTRRLDRKAERTGDADLNAYNAMLARMAAREQGQRRAQGEEAGVPSHHHGPPTDADPRPTDGGDHGDR